MDNQIKKDILVDRVIQVLKTIYDPEIPVNIYDLGLVYKIEVDDNLLVNITMTLTSPNCPVAESLPEEVYEKVKNTNEVTDVVIKLTFEPPWDKEMISDEGLLDLGLL